MWVEVPLLSRRSNDLVRTSGVLFTGLAAKATVFVGGETFPWLYYELRPDGVVRLGYNSNQFVECSVSQSFFTSATIRYTDYMTRASEMLLKSSFCKQ